MAQASGAGVPSGRLDSIDFLRGVAATAVVLCHALDFDQGPRWLLTISAVAERGSLGVPLFFVVSGFCIHLKWARQRARGGPAGIDFVDFWKRRLRRLYPPYLITLCLSMLAIAAAYLLGRHTALVQRYPDPKLWWMGADFGLHVLMLHGLHPLFDKMGGNPPYWTLAREEYFYMMYFFLLALRRRTTAWGAAAAALAVGAGFHLLFVPWLPAESGWWKLINSSAPLLWFQWVLGLVAIEAHYRLLVLRPWMRAWWMVPLWALGAELMQLAYKPFSPFLWGMCFFTLVNACVDREQSGRWSKAGWVRFFTGLGVFSYSMYLLHYVVLAVLRQGARPLSKAVGPVGELVLGLLMAVIAVAASRLYFHLVERRFLNAPSEPARGS